MNATTETTITTSYAPPAPAPLKIEEARKRIISAISLADDEQIFLFGWTERDEVCRMLTEALRLIREYE